MNIFNLLNIFLLNELHNFFLNHIMKLDYLKNYRFNLQYAKMFQKFINKLLKMIKSKKKKKTYVTCKTNLCFVLHLLVVTLQ